VAYNLLLSPEFLEQGMVLYVAHPQIAEGNPHYWVVLNKEIDESDPVLYLVATSKIDKVESYCKKVNPKLLNALVCLNAEEEALLTKDTVLNCNEVNPISLRQLNKLEVKYKGKLKEETIRKVIIAVNASVRVKVELKKKIV